MRAEHYGEKTHKDTVSKGAYLLKEYLEAGWIQKPTEDSPTPSTKSISVNGDGSQCSEGKFEIEDESSLRDPIYLLNLHGYNVKQWELVNSKNSFWDVQTKSNGIKTLYSSKVTVKPVRQEWTLEDINKYFLNKKFINKKQTFVQSNYDPNGEVLEITLPDFHGGLLTWHGETGWADYDVKIAKECFYKCLNDIIERINNRKFSKIYFVPLGDLIHADTVNGTTSKGTVLDCDGRFSKYFSNTLDMIIDAIQILSKFSKVEVPYISGNHDRILGYALIKAVSKAFQGDDNVIIDDSPNPRKFRKEGKVLIGWCHGDMPKQNISEWLQTEARKEFGECLVAEVHGGHYHSQQVVEKSGIIIRYLPTICPSSSWEHTMGFPRTQRCIVSFVWNPICGLREMWYSNI